MPELPDVELFHRLVVEHCRGKVIERTIVSDAGILENISAEALARRVNGARIQSAERHGKHLFLILGGVGALAMHFGTNGSLQSVASGSADPAYTRLKLQFAGGKGLAYVNPRRIGRVLLSESVKAFITQAELGPDALDPALDRAAFAKILAESKRDIKAVLMDQALMAGIGNIYSDEILFQARLNPAAKAAGLDRSSAADLFASMQKTLNTAIRCHAGSEHAVENLPKSFLLRERHRGGHCPHCHATLATVKHAGRTGYYCPNCQPKSNVRQKSGR